MTATGTKRVKLSVYRHESKETVIDIYKSTDWGDFVIVSLDMAHMSYEQMEEAKLVFEQISQRNGKQYILIPSDVINKVEFYGVTID